jgi:hypothetical protein
MKVMVVGVLALAGALVREPDEALRDWQAQGGAPQTMVLPRLAESDVGDQPTRSSARDRSSAEAAAAISDPASPAAVDSAGAADSSPDSSSDSAWAPGHWEIACEIKNGSALVFDRASLRDYGPVTLFRWSAPPMRVAGPGGRIFTGVVNCREKTIEAAWPGRSRETYAGTCGRGLLEAVCAASESATSAIRSRVVVPPRATHGAAGAPSRR